MTQAIFPETEKKERIQGITRISVYGYKSLYEECSIEVRPLTILAGANSSGKSSIMQPLLLLKQTLEATYDPGALLIDGPYVKFTSIKQLLSHLSVNKSSDRFAIEIHLDDNQSLKNTFQSKEGTGLELIEMKYDTTQSEIVINENLINRDLKLSDSNSPKLGSLFSDELLNYMKVKAVRSRCFFDMQITHSIFGSSTNLGLTNVFQQKILNLIHLPGLRGNPERTYKITAVNQELSGIFETYIASIISKWQTTNAPELKHLNQALETLGVNGNIEARKINDVQIELSVSRLSKKGETSNQVSLADVGFGVSQILPVLVALIVAKPGQLVHIEQPEIHLHPRAQVALAQILIDAANRGVKVVIETHSELLLLAIQTLVAEGKLSPDLVKLHWFTRREDGVTEVNSADLDDAGAFGNWPEDFGQVSLNLESRYLDAAEARLLKH